MSRPSSLILIFLTCVSSAFGQLNSAELRARFGAPLDRETFHVADGFDLVVDYGPGMAVCKLEVPSLMPSNERVVNLVEQSRRMYEFLMKLIPEMMRGKEMGRRLTASGINALVSIEYENMIITEPRRTGEEYGTTTITVRFKDSNCNPQ